MKSKVSIKDIAQKAKVSTAAVSYVLNNQENRVSPAMAVKIKSIAAKLNYRPHHIARSLKIRKTKTIGLVVADIRYRFTTGITSAIEAEAKKNGYSVLIGSSDENKEKFEAIVNVLIDRQVDGLILLPVEDSLDAIKNVKQQNVPFVLLDRYFPDLKSNVIALNNYQAMYNIVEYLHSLNHDKIYLINYKTTLFNLQERTRGFLDGLKSLKLPRGRLYQKSIRREHFTDDLLQALKDITGDKGGKPAVIFASDTLAVKGLKVLNQLNIDIPEELSVVSFDESESFELFKTSVTHSRQPLAEMGQAAVKLLLKSMDRDDLKQQVLLDAEFVEGSSCAE